MNESSITLANSALIRYPRFKELHRDIRDCQEMSHLSDEPQCMALEGVTGAGKSTLIRDYISLFPRTEQPDGTRIPIFYIETPSPVTVKGMASTMLTYLGDPASQRGTLCSMNFRLIKLMIDCKVELVVLDDFQHLIDKETNCILEQVSDWLKVLIKETNLPFLVVGLSGKVERILTANLQLSRLFAVRETLEPFKYNPSDYNGVTEFARFIQYAEKGIGIELADTLPRQELLYLLHYATDGVVGNLMNLLRYAALCAQREKKTKIDFSMLAYAFSKRLSKHLKEKLNPFDTANKQFIASSHTDCEFFDNNVSHKKRLEAKLLQQETKDENTTFVEAH